MGDPFGATILPGVWGHNPRHHDHPAYSPTPKKHPDQTVPPPCSFLRRSVSGPDPYPKSSSGSSANPLHDSCFNRVIFETGHFNQEKTVQFSGPVPVAKNRQSQRPSGNPLGPGGPLWPKNNRVSRVPRKRPVFSRKCGEMPSWYGRCGAERCSGQGGDSSCLFLPVGGGGVPLSSGGLRRLRRNGSPERTLSCRQMTRQPAYLQVIWDIRTS